MRTMHVYQFFIISYHPYVHFSVHCELLGNTPTHKGDIRNEMMRERLRKKLKERKKQKGLNLIPFSLMRCKVYSRPHVTFLLDKGGDPDEEELDSREWKTN